MKTKEKVEQGKGTTDHLMPLGYLLFIHSLDPTPPHQLGPLSLSLSNPLAETQSQPFQVSQILWLASEHLASL